MTSDFIDTSVIIRLVTGDDIVKQTAAGYLFERLESGELSLGAPDTVIADAVYVLSSPRLYKLPRDEIRDQLLTLLRLPQFRVQNRAALIRALEIYSETNIDFS